MGPFDTATQKISNRNSDEIEFAYIRTVKLTCFKAHLSDRASMIDSWVPLTYVAVFRRPRIPTRRFVGKQTKIELAHRIEKAKIEVTQE